MYFAGISDEAGQDLESQIRAHRELGWEYLEPRNIGDQCITDLSDEDFEATSGQLNDAGLKIVGFASQLANWARPVDNDFQVDIDELNRAIPRMQQTGAKFIRCMSYPNRKESPLSESDWGDEVVRRFKILAKLAEDGGVTIVHENCHGWASQTPQHSLQFIERVGSPALRLVFDTGNEREQDTVAYYQAVKQHVVHVHVKDWKRNADGTCEECFPGEGDSGAREILEDLIQTGYDGCLSIEPHMVAVIHLGKSADDDPERAYNLYVEFGRRLEKLVEGIRKESR